MGTITQPTAQRFARSSGHPPDRILGTADIARRFGVTRQRVGQIVRTDRTFPRPGLRDGAGDAWVAGGVECWAAAHRPTAETGRFGPEAAALLRHAEALAEALNQGYIDTAHLWHAIASGVAGDALAAAVCSMGLDPGTIGAWLAMHVVPRSSSRRMTPWTQDRLEAADRLARDAGRTEVPSADIAIAFLDSRRQGRHSGDHLIAHAEQRGLDTQELRDRVGRAGAEPEASFVLTPLPKRRPRSRRRRRPAWMVLAPNPLGHDPWERQGWGSAFAVTSDGRHLQADGYWWFFHIDADGFYIRSRDGRPVGYRYRVFKKVPKRMPGRPRTRILPMPPVPMRDWPDRRYDAED